ncbi:MAG TPA: hypothetical protein VGM54_02395 [Chthoniobacter sp.]
MRKSANHQNGSALLAVMLVVMVAVALSGAAYVATTSQGLLTSRSADVTALEIAGEGVLDYAYGQWKSSLDSNGLLNATDSNALIAGANQPAVPANMQIVSLSLTPVDQFGLPSTDAVQTLDCKMSVVYTYLASVALQTSGVGGKRTVSLRRTFVYTAVPPTRGMFFSEGDFELYKPAKMVIGGDVHTNGSAHVSTGTGSSNLEFLSSTHLSYVGGYDNGIPAGAANWNDTGTNYPPTYDGGLANQVKKVTQISGIGLGTEAEYDTTDANDNNDGNHELIEPPDPKYPDPPAIASSRLYNTAGVLININGPIDQTASLTQNSDTFSGGNISITAQNGTTLTTTQATAIRNAITNAVTTQVQTWVPDLVQVTTGSGRNKKTTTVDEGHYVTSNVVTQETLYDKREVQSVPITDVNVGSLTPTLNSVSGFNGVVYLYDTGSGDKNAIRVKNGGVLPDNGLTVATEGGIYVQGDYNTGTTTNPNAVPSNSGPGSNVSTVVPGYTAKSAALVGDAITVLSNSWSDSNASSSVSNRNATNTTLNTALVAGYLTSESGGNNGRSGYSGGMNNFPRFLESWTNDNMTFSGAFVSLYESQTFTGSWDTGDIYVPPTRYWYFDTMLLTRMLPGIPSTGGCIRGPLSRL